MSAVFSTYLPTGNSVSAERKGSLHERSSKSAIDEHIIDGEEVQEWIGREFNIP